jgi:hypothetical protein
MKMVEALEYGLKKEVQEEVGKEAKSFVTRYYDHTNIAKDLIKKYQHLLANPYMKL